ETAVWLDESRRVTQNRPAFTGAVRARDVRLLAQDDAQDHAGRDADQQRLAAIAADVLVAARRLAQALTAIIDAAIVRALIRREPVAAPPITIAGLVAIAVYDLARGFAVIPAAVIGVAVVLTRVPALRLAHIAPRL